MGLFKHKYRIYFALGLSFFTYLATELCRVYYFFNIQTTWFWSVFTITSITVLLWELCGFIEPWFKKSYKRHNNKTRFLIYFWLAGGAIAVVVATAVVIAVTAINFTLTVPQLLIPLKLNVIYALLINLLFHLINAILFYFEEYKRQVTETEALRRISTETELELIKSQINPHFLFNNLNILSALVMKNHADANKFIEEFSKVYRYILSSQHKELVTVSEEISFMSPYLFLLQKRFGEGLRVNITVPEKFKNHYIIPASLQMLVENALKHNIVSNAKPLTIDINIDNNNISIQNNLQLRTTVLGSTKIGLQNISKRYQLVSELAVAIETTTEKFKVSLPLIPIYQN
jgi:two-component system, LytTR family, sensor kinase